MSSRAWIKSNSTSYLLLTNMSLPRAELGKRMWIKLLLSQGPSKETLIILLLSSYYAKRETGIER